MGSAASRSSVNRSVSAVENKPSLSNGKTKALQLKSVVPKTNDANKDRDVIRDVSYTLAQHKSSQWKREIYGDNYLLEKDPLAHIKLKVDSWRKVDIDHLLSQSGDAMWWQIAPKLRTLKPKPVLPDKKRKGWKNVRLFVSSTFRDMQNERELLVKRIFPQLRAWCEKRKLRLLECDLRWGVPKDANTREVILTCLAEIDRCVEENVQPYFLALLSERYGWTPQLKEIAIDLQKKYKYIPGLSITAWEVMNGAFWDDNPNALYCLRKSECVEKVRNVEGATDIVFEKSPECQKSITILKDKLMKSFPNQVYEYDCEVTSANPFELSKLDAFGVKVFEFFKQRLAYQYPSHTINDDEDAIAIQRELHDIFMTKQSQVVIGRESINAEINKYILSAQHVNDAISPVVIIGCPGSGKSSLLALVASESMKRKNLKVFFHFIGSAPGSTHVTLLLMRMWAEILPMETPPSDAAELKSSMELLLKRASHLYKRMGKTLVFILDGLNQLDPEGNTLELHWLPKHLPHNVRIIVSTLSDDLFTSDSKYHAIEVEPLEEDCRKTVAMKILGEYGKKLDSEQLRKLVCKEDAGCPLYLCTAVEELRVYGIFENIDSKIKNFPDKLQGLLQQVLRRIETELGDLAVAALCLLATSKTGLLEVEILEMLVFSPILPGGSTTAKSQFDKLPMSKWSPIFFSLRPFIQLGGNQGQGCLNFNHPLIAAVVRKLHLTSANDVYFWHNRIIKYFELSTDMERVAEELPYHLVAVGDMSGLKSCIVKKDIFDYLYVEGRKHDLLKFWRLCGGYKQTTKDYIHSYNSYLQDNNVTDEDAVAAAQVKLCWFFIDIAEYSSAEILLNGVLQILTEKYGASSSQLMDPYYALVTMKHRQVLAFVFNTDPGYLECKSIGLKYAKICVQIFKMYRNSEDLLLGQVLTVCGYFIGESCLLVAKKIFEKLDSQRSLADVLMMLGEKNQYHNDIKVPTQYFDSALDLALKHYGSSHIKTARCYQMYAQFCWNSYIVEPNVDLLNKSFDLYETEVKIQEELVGKQHSAYKHAVDNLELIKTQKDKLTT